VTTPESFDTYVAISPSVWWDRDGLAAGLRNLAGRRTAASPAVKVFITAGEYEQKLAPWQLNKPKVGTVAERREDRRMVDQAREFASALESVANVATRFDELAGQDHASVVPLSISEALRLAFRD
jgi:predicted alpha/beta superfamily hydrolase